MQHSYADKLEDKQVCSDCIGEDYLKRFVIKSSDVNKRCSYCGSCGSVVPLGDLADLVEEAFERHYSRTDTEPDSVQYGMMHNEVFKYTWERDGLPIVDVIMDVTITSEKIAEDIRNFLEEKHFDFEKRAMGEEGEFSAESYYTDIEPSYRKWQTEWEFFERTIKTEIRFFNEIGVTQLKDLFDTIDEMKTRQGKSLIIKAGPNAKHIPLYRARVFQNDEQLKAAIKRPDKELGAPPSGCANSGRMNANGISVFYGATSVDTALTEVRPPVGSKVAVAQFEIIRLIQLLDLTALEEVQETGSVFDPSYAYRRERTMFLRELSKWIARPVMPDDQKVEYLPTQAIADFLATRGKVPLDGILFRSAQVNNDGLNLVLFHKASRCKEIDIPEGVELEASIPTAGEDDLEFGYTVYEKLPSEEEISSKETSSVFSNPNAQSLNTSDYDNREETLSVNLNSITVHQVAAVEIKTSKRKVNRLTVEKRQNSSFEEVPDLS